MTKLQKLLARVRVIATSVVTWLTLAAALAPYIAAQVATVAPPGVAETVTTYALTAVGWINVAIAIIRRVAPVPAENRGVLPPTKETHQ